MKDILFLASGNGGNLKALHIASKFGMIKGFNFAVLADRDCGAVSYALKNGIENYIVEYSRDNSYEVCSILRSMNPDAIVTNWHKIIDANTVNLFSGKMVNLHYSLLPAFPGLLGMDPLKRAYERGCKYSGATCHLVDEGVDTGKILAQSVFDLNRSYDDAVELMFQMGVMTLFVGLKLQQNESQMLEEEGFIHEGIRPSHNLDQRFSDPVFWSEVARV